MVTITAGTQELNNAGDLKMITMDLTAIANAETLTIVDVRRVTNGFVNCTTDDQTQFTIDKNVITFVNGATLAGKLTIWGK